MRWVRSVHLKSAFISEWRKPDACCIFMSQTANTHKYNDTAVHVSLKHLELLFFQIHFNSRMTSIREQILYAILLYWNVCFFSTNYRILCWNRENIYYNCSFVSASMLEISKRINSIEVSFPIIISFINANTAMLFFSHWTLKSMVGCLEIYREWKNKTSNIRMNSQFKRFCIFILNMYVSFHW